MVASMVDLDASVLWKVSSHRRGASGSNPRTELSTSLSQRDLLVCPTTTCSPPPSLYPTPATTAHPDPSKRFRLPKKTAPWLEEEGLAILRDGHAAEMPKEYEPPALEWHINVIDLRGKTTKVWTADWEGVTRLRERIAKRERIYPARKLFLHSWPKNLLVQDGGTISESGISPGCTLYCSLASEPLSKVWDRLPYADIPPIPPLPPATQYPDYIRALPTNTIDDITTLYASILTYHFPPYQSFHIHTHEAPGIPDCFAIHHELHNHPLLLLSFMHDDTPKTRNTHISALVWVAAHSHSPYTYLLTTFGPEWSALGMTDVDGAARAAETKSGIARNGSAHRLSADTPSYDVRSHSAFAAFSRIANDLKAFYLPTWNKENDREIVVRLPIFRISTTLSSDDEECAFSKASSWAASYYGPKEKRILSFWSGPPDVIDILPPMTSPCNSHRFHSPKVRLPAVKR